MERAIRSRRDMQPTSSAEMRRSHITSRPIRQITQGGLGRALTPLASVGTLVLGLRCSWCPGDLVVLGVKQLGAYLAAGGLLGRTAIAKNWRAFLNITLRAMPYLTDSRQRPLKWREAVAGHIQGGSVARKADLSIRIPKKAKVAIDKAAGHGYCSTASLVERILLDCALASNAGRPRRSLTPASALLNPPASEQMLADLAAHLARSAQGTAAYK
jgi:hypothetical protein